MADERKKIEPRTIGIPRHGVEMPAEQRPKKRGGQAPVAVSPGPEPAPRANTEKGGDDESN